jgi:hypothetical protein
MRSILFVPLILLFQGCFLILPIFPDDDDFSPDTSCKEPIYLSYAALRQKPDITKGREITQAGKIYLWKDILFVNEPNKGIHVIDKSDPAHPKNRYFIDLPGNIDIAIKDGYLYADSFIDLVVLDIKDIDHITPVHREEGVFAYDPYQALDPNLYYCGNLSPKKGVIVGYKE